MINFLREPTVTEYKGSKRYTFDVMIWGLHYSFAIILDHENVRFLIFKSHDKHDEFFRALARKLSKAIENHKTELLSTSDTSFLKEVIWACQEKNLSLVNKMNCSLSQSEKEAIQDSLRLGFILDS